MNKQTEVQATQTPVFKSVRGKDEELALEKKTIPELNNMLSDALSNFSVEDQSRLRSRGPTVKEIKCSPVLKRVSEIQQVLKTRESIQPTNYQGIV